MNNKKSLVIALFLVLGPFVGAAAVYFFNFLPLNGFRLSAAPQDWAAFGDYIGGTLGPYYALLAFGGLVYTIHLQQKQLSHIERQSVREEWQRLLSTVAARIDNILDSDPTYLRKTAELRGETLSKDVTLSVLLSTAGPTRIESDFGKSIDPAFRVIYDTTINGHDFQIASLEIEVRHLHWCLQQFERVGGSIEIAAFYMRRYQMQVTWLDALGKISSDEVRAYFGVEVMRSHYRPAGTMEEK